MIIHEGLKHYWNQNVSKLVYIKEPDFEVGQIERHQLYSLLLMSIIHYYWNGLKYGRVGEYPLNPKDVDPSKSPFMQNDYLGHNIAAIAVDRNGSIIDFDFNHNTIFSSSAEHAEMRVVKRIYSLSQINDSWEVGNNTNRKYFKFSDVTLYTSLESCAQCSGVMTLANVKEVIYLQTDPSQYFIGNIMRNLSREGDRLLAPMPIKASQYNFSYFERLDHAYSNFYKQNKTFFISKNNNADQLKTQSITSFLCTNEAYLIYSEAREKFNRLIKRTQLLNYPTYKPSDFNHIKTNMEVLDEVADFYEYAIHNGRRGTAH